MIESVDLFCGVGGLTAGLRLAGIRVRAGYDIDNTCKYAFEQNNDAIFNHKDVANVTGEEIARWYSRGTIRLLAGCAPCQPFSTYSQGRDVRKDKKWPLLYQFARLIQEVRPELVTMENVPDVTKHEVYNDFVSELEKLGYYIWAERVSCDKYGLPQRRKRHVLLASQLGPIRMIEPTHEGDPPTVDETIGLLPAVAAGESDPSDPLHRAASLSDLNLARIRASTPGGTWRDWPEALRASCHRKSSGKTYPSVYGRMKGDEPSPTITTLCYGFGNGRFGHPVQDRAITLREAALLQSFPRDYVFVPPGAPLHFKTIGRMIGNAVPVRLGEAIGLSLVNHVRDCKREERIHA